MRPIQSRVFGFRNFENRALAARTKGGEFSFQPHTPERMTKRKRFLFSA